MSSILFLAEVMAFLTLIASAFLMEASGSATRSLLGMREDDAGGVPAPLRPEAGWRRVPKRVAVVRVAVQKPKSKPRLVGPTPAWRRRMRSDRED